MPQGYRTRGEDARRLGEFANQFGDRLIGVRARVQQARRARDVSDYLSGVGRDYTAEISADPSDEAAYRAAVKARGRAAELGAAPEAKDFINHYDEQVRYRGARIAGRQPKPTVQSTQDIPLQRGGMRRLIGYGTTPNDISDYEVLNLADPSPDMNEYQRESLALRREAQGKSKENDLTGLHLKREQLGKTINEWQNNFDKAEAIAVEKGEVNVTFPKDYVIEQKKKVMNQLALIEKQIKAKGGTVDEGIRPQSATTPKVGNTKTFKNGKKGRWDGQGWEQID